ncbi:hypothetical protein Taro_012459 [Colocasia esculenta]|uniref:Uncharacterized protein n=1 Tax=Colocasia esculenta TaxID=4460 RepID=A0A843UDJ7_COLES|nr:hypothetical protein [Colocasia esculenta]
MFAPAHVMKVDVVFLDEVAQTLYELKDDVRRDLTACRFGTLHELKDDVRHDLKVFPPITCHRGPSSELTSRIDINCHRGHRRPRELTYLQQSRRSLRRSTISKRGRFGTLPTLRRSLRHSELLCEVRSGGRKQLRTSAKRASKGFDLVVSAPSGEKRLNGHLGWSRAMLL